MLLITSFGFIVLANNAFNILLNNTGDLGHPCLFSNFSRKNDSGKKKQTMYCFPLFSVDSGPKVNNTMLRVYPSIIFYVMF